MERLNVFQNIFTNVVFLSVLFFTVVFQVVIVEFLGRFASTVPLNAKQWAISVLLGFLSLFVGVLIKLIPVPSKPFVEIIWGMLGRTSQGDDFHNGYKILPSEC
jgi:Ca2+-transporting ATPase